MSAFDQEDHALAAALAGMGWAPDTDGLPEPERITGKPLLQRIGELAVEASALGLWETTRSLTRLQSTASRELRQVTASELAPSALTRRDR